jgi:hypothetical protein
MAFALLDVTSKEWEALVKKNGGAMTSAVEEARRKPRP